MREASRRLAQLIAGKNEADVLAAIERLTNALRSTQRAFDNQAVS